MDWHVEQRGALATCFRHPYQAIAATLSKGASGDKRTATEWSAWVLCELRAVYARRSLAFVAFLDSYIRPFVTGMFLLCSGPPSGKEAVGLRPLQQSEPREVDARKIPDPAQPQEKSFCEHPQLQLAIPSCLDNITFVGAVINAACLALAFSAQEATQIELCVVEAVVNAIKHAYAGRPGHIVEIRAAIQADRLVLQVCDYGLAMTGEIPSTLDFDPADIAQVPEGGMGLFLMHSLMDEVSYESSHGANILTMTRRMSA